jgi:signal transduction histidine kinase
MVRFARLASEASGRAAILPLLADTLSDQVGADAVAIVEIRENGEVGFVASPHLPQELENLELGPDDIGEELDARFLGACNAKFDVVRSHPLVSGGGLFGTVILFFATDAPRQRMPLAEGLVDLAAIALDNLAKVNQISRSQAALRASQDALVRTEKLRALGQMAAGVSHDLKNVLNPLSLHIQFVQRAVDRGHTAEAREALVEMKQVLTRGVQTIERLRDYSRQSPESRAEHLDLNALAREASEIARPRLAARGGSTSHIVLQLGEAPLVTGRPGEIVSALVNLVVNAIDAMPGGGTVTLRTGRSDGASWAQVADDGPGMPPEIEQHVFEPFFTTKGLEGTGLGLAMVYACMQRHGGSVKLDTAPGKGASFTLVFPRAALDSR